jgi:hypothetical protein
MPEDVAISLMCAERSAAGVGVEGTDKSHSSFTRLAHNAAESSDEDALVEAESEDERLDDSLMPIPASILFNPEFLGKQAEQFRTVI